MNPLLEIKDLSTHFRVGNGMVKAVDGLSLRLSRGETLGLVGESGSGKSMTALSVLRLVPQPAGEIVNGEIIFKGENLLEKSQSEMREIRGREIAIILQDPMTSLNPVTRIGEQVAEVSIYHEGARKQQAWEKAIKMMEMVRIPLAKSLSRSYPHQFSGGMRQRSVIAMALSCNPSLLIADEPTTALDVTIQAQVLELMRGLKKQYDTAIILITHDLAVVAEMCDKVGVMYAGRMVEYGDVVTIFQKPLHPYTQGLLGSLPRLDDPERKLKPVRGMPPALVNPPSICLFSPRCEHAMDGCLEAQPDAKEIAPGHFVSCFLYDSPSRASREELGVSEAIRR